MTADVSETCYLSIEELGRSYTAHELSPVEVTEAYLTRIRELDPILGTYITVTGDLAITHARASEARFMRGASCGPLDGVPVGIKDLIDTKDALTTGGSRLWATRVPAADATVVARLLDAGGVLLGKQALYEFACGGPATDGIFPAARNPWDVSRVTAGSSSGSAAAVAAGLAAGSFGTDTGGSIRSPAAICGLVGHKPTYGLVSRGGIAPLGWTLDHCGPFARTVGDAALLLGAMAGHDPRDTGSAPGAAFDGVAARGVSGLRIGVPWKFIESVEGLTAETLRAFREAVRALEKLGAVVHAVEFPDCDEMVTIGWLILTAEALAFHERDAQASPELYGRRFYESLLEGALVSAVDYIQAQRARAGVGEHMRALMRECDLLVTPSTPQSAWPMAVELGRDGMMGARAHVAFCFPFNLTGQPAISVPCGFTAEGLPIGLQIAGRPFEDGLVFAAARAYEQAHDWWKAHPTLGA